MAIQLKEEGNVFFKEGDFIRAHEKYTEALRYDSSNSVIYSNRSLVSAKLKKYELALSDALECIKLNPQWSKGFVRKAVALEGLGRQEEMMQSAVQGFRLSGEGPVKKELVSLWMRANQIKNHRPDLEELPGGIVIMSQDYFHVLVCLMQSLSGERPLSLSLMEQCLFLCAQQLETLLLLFGEPVQPIIKEWARCLPHEVYPHEIHPCSSSKAKLEREMKSRSEAFVKFLSNDIDPAVYPVIRPVLGLVVLVVLNRTNILTECNTGHHAVELMNRALLPVFEASVLSNDVTYYSLYVGRICAVVDSFIGRGYRLDKEEITAVGNCCKKLEKALRNYPKTLPGYFKDKELAERALSNAQNNILLPASSSPPKIPHTSSMSVEMAEQIVKEKPQEAKAYIVKHLEELESVKFLTMGEVEELLAMTGIFYELGMEDSALKVFKKGEQAFFQVLGHMLSSSTLKLDQCPAMIAPMRQLVLCEASLLKERGLLADVILRWKCFFKELRKCLIRHSSGGVFSAFYQWYTKQLVIPEAATAEDVEAALLKQMQEEELLLQTFAESTLAEMAKSSYSILQKHLADGVLAIDYIFFAPLKTNPLLEAYCIIFESGTVPVVCKLDYKAIHNQAALVGRLVSQAMADGSKIAQGRINAELALLAKTVFPKYLVELLTSRNDITHLYISPDSDIVGIPIDLLPVSFDSPVLLLERFSVSILPSMRELMFYNSKLPSDKEGALGQTCSIIGNPNFNLHKPATEASTVEKLVNYFYSYFSTASNGPILDQLQHSQDEVDYVALQLKSQGLSVKALVSDEAVLSNVLSVENPILLHISSHAYSCTKKLSGFRGNFFADLQSSAIALSGFNTFSRGNFDQLRSDCGPAQLQPLAIFSMKLRGTKLVYLSTCDSAAGTAPMQEAIDSLAEAFLVAGAETVIATLWPVADQLAAKFSKYFYDRLTTPGVRPSQALKYAKQCFRRFNADTQRHWLCYAAFVCYGLDKPFLVM